MGLEHFQSFLNVFAAQGLFLFFGQYRISHHASDALALQDSIHTHHLSDIWNGSDLNDRDTYFFNFRCDRCSATSARPSGGSEDDRINASPLLDLSSHLLPHFSTSS